MKIRNILFAAAAAALLASCGDKLVIDQHGVMPVDSFYQTDEQVLQANAENYNVFRNGSYGFSQPFQHFYIGLNEMLSDDCWSGGESRGDFAEGEPLNEFNYGTENSYISSYYGYLYCIIYRANIVLDKTTEGQSDIVDMCRAEAKVFRAWANFELASMWGNAPLVDHCLTSDEYSVSNSQDGELWAFIEKDLTEAIGSGKLSEKSSVSDKSTWRITKQFAQAMLGKTYLWEKKYAEAASMLDNVINSGKYELFSGNFGDMTRMANKFNSESIFEINRVVDFNNMVFGFIYTYYSWRTQYFVNILPGYAQTGWGWMVPQKSLYDAFESYEGHDSYRRKETMKTYQELQDMCGMRVSNGSTVYQDLYFGWKYRYLAEDYTAMIYFYSNNFYIMRLGEVLLLAAEAHLQNGNAAKATEYVNQIRRRAQLPDLGTVTMDNIKMEKRLELAFESIRYKDLIRWGDAEKVLGNQGESIPFLTVSWVDENDASKDNVKVDYRHYYTSKDQYGFKEKHKLLPYPNAELISNPNITQNPGW